MIGSLKSEALAKFYEFFDKAGTERIKGLDESYFETMSEADRREAWDFLEPEFVRSSDAISGLYLLDRARAVALFRAEIDVPVSAASYPALRRNLESNKLLMLRYINKFKPDAVYIDAMTVFADSEFDEIRGEFAQSLPVSPVTRGAVRALKRMIFTEIESIPLTSAITKLMVMHGMDFDRRDPVYKSIFVGLMSDNPNNKIACMAQLEQRLTPDYLD